MFGYVMASVEELSPEERRRYEQVYCGICRAIREQAGNVCRMGLSYDMVFLALLLMSLYEPESEGGPNACMLHPVQKRPWLDNVYIRYAADMNVALGYYNCLDDWEDDRRVGAKLMAGAFKKPLAEIEQRYPRQCRAIESCIAELGRLEKENCSNPDGPAGCFGRLMAELLVYKEDMWAPELRQVGMALGRFVYLADAAVDYRRDLRHHKYNPFLAMGTGEDWPRWESYLVLAMGRCTEYFEKLPLVEEKGILNNILYSGVWVELRRRQRQPKEQEERNDR